MVPTVDVQLVKEFMGIRSVSEVCQQLGVARASYYRWRKNSEDRTEKEIRNQKIGELCKLHKYRYGYRKITLKFLNS